MSVERLWLIVATVFVLGITIGVYAYGMTFSPGSSVEVLATTWKVVGEGVNLSHPPIFTGSCTNNTTNDMLGNVNRPVLPINLPSGGTWSCFITTSDWPDGLCATSGVAPEFNITVAEPFRLIAPLGPQLYHGCLTNGYAQEQIHVQAPITPGSYTLHGVIQVSNAAAHG